MVGISKANLIVLGILVILTDHFCDSDRVFTAVDLPRSYKHRVDNHRCDFFSCNGSDLVLKNFSCRKIIGLIALIENKLILLDIRHTRECSIYCTARELGCDKSVLETVSVKNDKLQTLQYNNDFHLKHVKNVFDDDSFWWYNIHKLLYGIYLELHHSSAIISGFLTGLTTVQLTLLTIISKYL